MSCVTLKFRSNGPTGPDNGHNKDVNWQIFYYGTAFSDGGHLPKCLSQESD